MTVKVITYNNPKKLESNQKFYMYQNCLHICATKNVRDGVFERYQRDSSFIKAPILTAMPFIKALLGEWMDAQTELEQYLYLTDFLRQKPLSHVDADIYEAFHHNKAEVLETMRNLTVLGLLPKDLEHHHLSPKEELFQKLWEMMEKKATSFKKLRDYLNEGIFNQYQNKKSFDFLSDLVHDAYGPTYKNSRRSNFDNVNQETIVLHGFYFITPLQQRIFQLLKNCGFQIVFLNLYDNRYPKSFSFIQDFINKENGWIDIEDWDVELVTPSKETEADKFLKSYEENQLDKQQQVPSDNLSLRKYHDFYEFLSDFQTNQSDFTFIAPNAQSLNERLSEYYPQLFRHKRSFLSYPIGKFFFQLHSMWDRVEEDLVLTESGLFEAFSSSWLYDKEQNKNARDYTKVLHDVMPFFKGCYLLSDWVKQASKLKEISEEVLTHFKVENDDRFQEMMGSPFSMFSHFRVSQADINQLVRFIEELASTAKELFIDQGDRINLPNHFQKLQNYISGSEEYLKMEEEEVELLENLQKKLQQSPSIDEFWVEDISEAIQLYLSGKLGKENEEEADPIRPFIEVDGESFKESVEDKITHVTGMDERGLPYSEFELPWPLSERLLEELCNVNKPLSLDIVRNRNVKKITRYLLYNLLQFTNNVELSWMVEFGEHEELEPTFYVTQLGLKPNQIKINNQSFIKELGDASIPSKVDSKNMLLDYPDDALAELIYCPRRFYYSYLADKYSSFQSEFIHEYLFGELIKTVSDLDKRDNSEEVWKLFPQWSRYKKQSITDKNYYSIDKTYTKYGLEDEFLDARIHFQFPYLRSGKVEKKTKEDFWKIKDFVLNHNKYDNDIREIIDEQLKHNPINMDATPGERCRYCPHNDICPDALFPVDDEARRM